MALEVGGVDRDGGGTWDESPRALTPAHILALQLHARGYSHEQIGRMVDQTPSGARALLDETVRRLGAATLTAAVREARARGLIT